MATEIEMIQIFKANDMVTESDLLLQFKVRELLNKTTNVPSVIKRRILDAEITRLTEDELSEHSRNLQAGSNNEL